MGRRRDPPLTAPEAGQLQDGADRIDRYWRRRGVRAAVRLGRVGIGAVGRPVLCRIAADPHRHHRLERARRPDRRRGRRDRPWRRDRLAVSRLRLRLASARRRGGSAISPCWRGPPHPDADGQPGASNGIPAGRLVLWTAILGALGVAIVIPYLGFDQQSFETALRGSFERMLRAADRRADGTVANSRRQGCRKTLLDLLVCVHADGGRRFSAPSCYMFNLWLSGRVVRMSGRLRRPWPDLPSMEFPPLAAALIAVALAGSFLPDIAGVIGGISAAALLIAYGALGLAVLHAITRGVSGRPVILGVVYALLVLQGWPILILRLLGLIDTAVDLRGRVARWRGTPTNTSNVTYPNQNNGEHVMEVILLERVGQARPDGRSRARQGRLRPQFPVAAGKGAARDQGQQRQVRRHEGAARSDQPRSSRATPKRSPPSSTDSRSWCCVRRPTSASCSVRSPRATSPRSWTTGGFTVTRSQIALNAPIKTIGRHAVPIALHPEVEATITVNVARSADEAERLARGEDITVNRDAKTRKPKKRSSRRKISSRSRKTSKRLKKPRKTKRRSRSRISASDPLARSEATKQSRCWSAQNHEIASSRSRAPRNDGAGFSA